MRDVTPWFSSLPEAGSHGTEVSQVFPSKPDEGTSGDADSLTRWRFGTSCLPGTEPGQEGQMKGTASPFLPAALWKCLFQPRSSVCTRGL